MARRMPGRASADPEAGYSLLEILVVIAIMGMLIGLVAPALLRQLGGAKVSIARQSIERLVATLDLYRLDIGSYPYERVDRRGVSLVSKGSDEGAVFEAAAAIRGLIARLGFTPIKGEPGA